MNKEKDNNESYKPINCFISEKAFSFLNALSDKLGWNQHEIISKAIEILWENEEEFEAPPKDSPLVNLLKANQQLMKKIDDLEKRITDLEAKK